MAKVTALMGLILAASATGRAAADDFDDCILSSLKGVNSDAAARMVREACQNKVKAAKDRKLEEEFGTPNTVLLVREPSSFDAVDSARLRNPSEETAVYVEIAFAMPQGKECGPVDSYQVLVYKTHLKPGGVGEFSVPGLWKRATKDGICFFARARRTRPSRWADVSLGQYQPLAASELDAVNWKLGTRYGALPTGSLLP